MTIFSLLKQKDKTTDNQVPIKKPSIDEMLKKGHEKIQELQRIHDRCQIEHWYLRKCENNKRHNNFEYLEYPNDSKRNVRSEITGYKSIKLTREIYETILTNSIEWHTESVSKHMAIGIQGIDPFWSENQDKISKNRKEAETHKEIIQFYAGLLKDSLRTPYEDRIPIGEEYVDKLILETEEKHEKYKLEKLKERYM